MQSLRSHLVRFVAFGFLLSLAAVLLQAINHNEATDGDLSDSGAAPTSLDLQAGSNYTFWIQQTGSNATTYQLDFVVVSEPASWVLLLVGGLVATRIVRRGT